MPKEKLLKIYILHVQVKHLHTYKGLAIKSWTFHKENIKNAMINTFGILSQMR